MDREGTTRVIHFLAQDGIDVVVITETLLKPEVNVFIPDFCLDTTSVTPNENA